MQVAINESVHVHVRMEDVLDVRARDRRPKLPPPVAQSGRADAGVEREAEARPVA